MSVSSDQAIRPTLPRPSIIMRPGALPPGEERYTVPGGGAIAVAIYAGDHVRVVDVEGMQRCELVAADAAGVIDPAILGASGDGDARGLKQILTAEGEGSSGAASTLPAPAPSRCSAANPAPAMRANLPSRATAC